MSVFVERAPLAVQKIEFCIDEGMNADYERALKMEKQGMSLLFSTRDMKEGIRAYLEGREPEFEGR